MITSLKLVSHLADAILRNGTTEVIKNQSYQFEVKENSSKYILFQCFDHVTMTYVLPLEYKTNIFLHCYYLLNSGLTNPGTGKNCHHRHVVERFYITKTSLFKEDLLTSHFYIVKLGFTGVYIIFLFLL